MSPHPAPTHWWKTQRSGPLLHWQLQLGIYSVVCCYCCFFFFLLFMLSSKIPKLPTDTPVREFPTVWKLFLFHDSLLGTSLCPNSFVSLCIFYILSYLILKRMGCLSGCLVSSTSVQKLFCGMSSAFKWSFDEFVEVKVVFLSYFSAVLGPAPRIFFFNGKTCLGGML